jgi:hypothetical protein
MKRFTSVLIAGAVICTAAPLLGGSHTWRVNEVFVNADGTIWFIELYEFDPLGSDEHFVGGHDVLSLDTLQFFDICIPPGDCHLTGDTTHKYLLFGNAAYAALPGAPPPDQVVAMDAFFDVTGDTIRYDPYDNLAFPSGLPTDGINSFNEGTGVAVNSPTNYAGTTGSVDASGGPAASGDVTLWVDRGTGPLPSVVLTWNDSCEADDTGAGVYRGTLASLALGLYNHARISCNVTTGTATVPMLTQNYYYLVVPSGFSTEGSYGLNTEDVVPVERPQGTNPCKTQAISCP